LRRTCPDLSNVTEHQQQPSGGTHIEVLSFFYNNSLYFEQPPFIARRRALTMIKILDYREIIYP